MCFLHCHTASIYNRINDNCQQQILRPRTSDKICSKTIISQTHQCKRTRFHDSNRMKQRRYWCWRHTCLWKPRIERTDSRFHAKSHKRKHVDKQQNILFVTHICWIEHSAIQKSKTVPIDNQENHTNKSKCRAS